MDSVKSLTAGADPVNQVYSAVYDVTVAAGNSRWLSIVSDTVTTGSGQKYTVGRAIHIIAITVHVRSNSSTGGATSTMVLRADDDDKATSSFDFEIAGGEETQQITGLDIAIAALEEMDYEVVNNFSDGTFIIESIETEYSID